MNKHIQIVLILILATTLEATGDAIIRRCIYQYTGVARIAWGIFGGLLVIGYGVTLNLAPVEFGKVVGLYIATLFVVWQIISYISTGIAPSLSIIIGGLMIFTGGLIVSFGKW